MSVEKGQLSIHTENFLPIIKKWLYSDRDIFVRELVSNCCDAVAKRRMTGETPEDYSPRVTVRVDKEHRILSFTDDGVGMTAEEVRKYINQVAFSGANDFLEKYKDSGEQIIGHFGLGFYSAFMVADKVRIDTLSCMPGEKAVTWESDGSVEYTMEESEREEVGTTVTLYLNDESDEFLDGFRMKEILRKYCSFMPTPIYCEVAEDEKKEEAHEHGDGCDCEDHEHEHEHAPEMLNTPNPLYLKAPKDCTEEEYKKFYRDTFHEWEEPLFWIHLNADYPFNLHGILYFPRLKNEFTANEGQVKLYSNQVFIADNIKEVVPEYLMLLKGVIDCPDLPLNVSRSFLQNDGDVQKISRHITKKVSDKLHSVFEEDRASFEGYWEDIAPFIKFGCIKDEKFYDRVKDIVLFKTLNHDYRTLEEYRKENEGQIFYVTDENVQAQYIRLFQENGMNAVLLTHAIDSHFISFLEYKESGLKFARIDSDLSDSMKTDGEKPDEEAVKALCEQFKAAVGKEDLDVQAENLKSKETPAIILVSEYERRLNDMSAMYGGMFPAGAQAKTTLVLNAQNDIVQKITSLPEEQKPLVCKYVYDLAMLSNQRLSADELSEFMKRSSELLKLAVFSQRAE